MLPTVTATWTAATSLTDFVRNIDFDQTFTATSSTIISNRISTNVLRAGDRSFYRVKLIAP